jgi:hypothetical protein
MPSPLSEPAPALFTCTTFAAGFGPPSIIWNETDEVLTDNTGASAAWTSNRTEAGPVTPSLEVTSIVAWYVPSVSAPTAAFTSNATGAVAPFAANCSQPVGSPDA